MLLAVNHNQPRLHDHVSSIKHYIKATLVNLKSEGDPRYGTVDTCNRVAIDCTNGAGTAAPYVSSRQHRAVSNTHLHQLQCKMTNLGSSASAGLINEVGRVPEAYK